MEYMGLSYFKLTYVAFDDFENICTSYYYRYQNGIGHEAMVCAVCLTMFYTL